MVVATVVHPVVVVSSVYYQFIFPKIISIPLFSWSILISFPNRASLGRCSYVAYKSLLLNTNFH